MQTPTDTTQVRDLAQRLDALTEDELILLAGVTPGTAEAWRKRGTGPAYVRLGNRVLYPRAAVAEFMGTKTRAPRTAAA
jgi:hypothetical protein